MQQLDGALVDDDTALFDERSEAGILAVRRLPEKSLPNCAGCSFGGVFANLAGCFAPVCGVTTTGLTRLRGLDQANTAVLFLRAMLCAKNSNGDNGFKFASPNLTATMKVS
ncbi:hypothetical protein [Thiorhodovibrio winogradskyi]|uniref:hypothetical protein n=1 Tax=Thiorhodovibrio winogradskyi TaxID=77007 RepID=UPI002E29E525|nr:hypothetical protein [Thiorhodovibrio winogradskyi]